MRRLHNSPLAPRISPAVIEPLENRLYRSVNPAVDLTVQHVQAPNKAIFIENNIVVGRRASVVVENRGTQAAKGSVLISFYLSADSTLDSADFLAGKAEVESIKLKPGRSKRFSELLIPPATTAVGNYFLFATVTPRRGIVQAISGDEVGEAAQKVVIAPHANRPTPQPPATETSYDGPMVICTPGCSGAFVSCADADSTPSGTIASPSTSPAKYPDTAPTTMDDPSFESPQPDADSSENPTTPAQDSPNSWDMADENVDQAAPAETSNSDDWGSSDSSGDDPSASDDAGG